MHYLAIAYRWGWTNAHQYHVALTQDEARCMELAREECDDRGGKYGVAVLKWSSETEYERVAYFPSSYGEEAPHNNERIAMFESIGHDVHNVVTTLTRWVASETPQGGTVPQAVEPPEWLVEFVRHREEHCRFMNAVTAHHQARRLAGLGKEPAEESKAWVEATMANVRREVGELLAKAADFQRDVLAAHAEREAERAAPSTPNSPTTA